MYIHKLKNQARIFTFSAIFVILAFAVYMLLTALSYGQWGMSAESLLRSLPACCFTFFTVFHAVALLRSVAKEETPFLGKNVRHLQRIGWAFVAYEPICYLSQVIANRYFPILLWDGIHMTTFETYGGVFLICGFVILAVSTIFRYGMELQQLSDETL